MILTLTLNPCIDRALFVEKLHLHDANRVVSTQVDAGGKGLNLSRVVAELGGKTMATGFLGGGAGAHIRAVLDQQGANHRFVPIAGETRTNFSVEDGSGPPTTFNEKGPVVSADELSALRDLLPELFTGTRWLAMGGSLPPGIPNAIYAEFIGLARSAGLRVLVDADKEPMVEAVRAKPDVIKPNADEASRLLGREIRTREEALVGAKELLPQLNDGGIAIISLGAEGAVLATAGITLVGLTPKVEVRSTIGSGDSLLGGFLWALEEGMPVDKAFQWGIACGAATATTSGSEIARLPVIRELLDQVQIDF